MWKSKFPNKTSSIPHSVDGATDHTDIANKFAFAFESACSSVSATKNNKWKEQFLNDIFQNESDVFDNNYLFDVECVDRVVSDMKRGKAASLDA